MIARAIEVVSKSYSDTDYITLDEAKTQLRVLGSDDDAYISSLISAGIQIASDYLGYPVVKSTCKFVFKADQKKGFVGVTDNILKVMSRVVSISTVQYYDADGVLNTADYAPVNNVYGNMGVNIYLNSLDSESLTDNYLVTAVCGFEKQGATANISAIIPDNVKQAILMIISGLYDNRQDLIPAMVGKVPQNSEWMLNPYKIMTFV